MAKLSAKEDIYNSIVNSYTVANAFERWQEYRERITDYIIKNTEPGKTMAILGVGESNDINLGRLYEHIGNLTLVDKDTIAMEKSIEKYKLQNMDNISLITADFVGITREEYMDAIGICLSDMKKMKTFFSPMVTGPKLIKKMDEIYEKVNSGTIDLGIEEHDYIVIIGVHSQLNGFLEHIWNIVMKAVGRNTLDYSKIRERALRQNDVFIPRFNDVLWSKAKERLFVGIEILETGRNCTVQGAQQTVEYIKEYVPQEELVVYQDVWPFTADWSYYMGLFNIKK